MGVVFDLFRVIRHGVRTRGAVVWMLDILYWVLVTPPILGLLWRANHGELRFYVVLGIIIGSLVYNVVCSVYVVEFLSMLWHGVGRALIWTAHAVVVVVTWPFMAVRSVVLSTRLRRPAAPARVGRFRLWRPALAWRRR